MSSRTLRLPIGLVVAVALIAIPTSLGWVDGDDTPRPHSPLASAPTARVTAPAALPAGAVPVRRPSSPGRVLAEHPFGRAAEAAVLAAQTGAGGAARVRHDRGSGRALAALRGARMLELEGPAMDFPRVRHETYRLHKDGLPVFNRSGRLHLREGEIVGHTGRLAIPPLGAGPIVVSAEESVDRSREAAPGRGLRAAPRVERGWLVVDGVTVPIWRVTLARAEPLATWQVNVDARDGRVLSRHDLVRTAVGEGRVYPENVVTTPIPLDRPLQELDGLGFLSGRITQVFDVREIEAYRPDLVFVFDEADPRFAQTSVYRGLSEAALYAEGRGLPPLTARVLAFTNLLGGPADEQLNNAFYDPFFPIFGFGNGDGSITANLSTDLDVAVHEMGHHVFQELVDPLRSSSLFSVAAIAEAFADTLAAFVTDDPEIGESTIPGQPFLRTLENGATWPDDASFDPHVEGLIFGGLNWDLRTSLGTDLAAQIVIEALPFIDPDADFPTQRYREALLQGDQAVTGGANRVLVEAIAQARGIDALDDLGVVGFLQEGVPVTGNLAEGEFLIYFFSEFPDSRELRFELTGTGDADILVAPSAIFDPADPSTFFFLGLSDSNETVVATRFTTPSVDDDDFWIVGVEDFADGSPSTFSLKVTSVLPEPAIDVGGSFVGTIEEGGEIDLLTFVGNAGEIVRLEATALTEDLDLAVSIFDPTNFEIFGADDDSGGGRDPLIQGASLPRTQLYAIGVFSLIADLDPTIGTGDYRLDLSLCDNVGEDFDNDGQVDACDDDDDDDGFVDAFDTEPLDPHRCQDIEDDGCDDCVSGVFDPFNDGDNADGDHLCDAGDVDDDNDGCEDEVDAFPFDPSVDEDVDFVGEDCDNCPQLYNPGQLDFDEDGLGDLCDPTPMPEPDSLLAALAALMMLVCLRRLRGPQTDHSSGVGAAGLHPGEAISP